MISAPAADTNAIQQVIQTYFNGYTQAEEKLVAEAFHPTVRLFSTDQGNLETTEMPEWLENLRQRKLKGDVREAQLKVDFIDVTGDAAVAKTVLTFPKSQFTDYLSFLRLNGAWRIIGKIYVVSQ